MALTYSKAFNPKHTQSFPPVTTATGKSREGSVYVYTEEIVLAVNVALATGRPLLVRGPSGCGKSTLARNVALTLGRRYYEQVVSSRLQARDLLWRVDLLRRLQDAQSNRLATDFGPYVVPAVLWWAFNPVNAAAQVRRSRSSEAAASDPADYEGARAVVLLDEIDKADPDVPNNLLVPLGASTFVVEEIGETIVAAESPLVFLSTNDERDLPPAFVRRCVELKIAGPQRDELLNIGRAHFGSSEVKLLSDVAELIDSLGRNGANPPSTAEYLDTIRACLALDVRPGTDLFKALSRVTMWKHGRTPAANSVS